MKKYLLMLAGLTTSVLMLTGCYNSQVIKVETYEYKQDIEDVDDEEVFASTDNSDEENKDVEEELNSVSECELEDGIYLAEFNTDNSMFHVNEMCDGKGELKVENGKMTIHVSLASKKILNLYYGLAEDAAKDGAVLLEPSIDIIDYDDGTTDEVHGFDIPVPYLDDEFDVALIGTKGKWYDHKVSVSNPVLKSAKGEGSAELEQHAGYVYVGDYTIELDLEGGTGKASVASPAQIKKCDDGSLLLVVEWSSPNYDYMIVDGVKYFPVAPDAEASVFEIPVESFDEPLDVTADTVAMSKPHEIEYTLVFHPDTMKEVE